MGRVQVIDFIRVFSLYYFGSWSDNNSMKSRNYTFDETILSDLYKDAYGHRPREYFWSDWNACNDEGKQRLWDALVDAVRDSVREEEMRQKKAIEDFEIRASFIENAKDGFGRKQFIEYLHDFHKTHGDVEALEFALDVPFGYISGKNWG